jgi:hypothetical protein
MQNILYFLNFQMVACKNSTVEFGVIPLKHYKYCAKWVILVIPRSVKIFRPGYAGIFSKVVIKYPLLF